IWGTGAVVGGSNLGTDDSVDATSVVVRARSSLERDDLLGPAEEKSNSSSIPRSPFLNSMIPLPSERPTSGSRLPNKSTATPISSVVPRLGRKANGSMVLAPKLNQYIGVCVGCGSHTQRRRRSVQCDSSGAPTIKVRVTTQAATAVAAMIARNQK